MAQRNQRYFSVIVEPEADPEDTGGEGLGYGATVGDILRHARQQTGYSLPDIAGVLRIRLRYLEAIEDGRFDDLPGSVYAVGFIRAYAEFLSLDTDEMVRRFKDEVAGIDRQTELNFPEPVAEGRVPGGAILMIALLLAVVAYGGWFYMSSENRGLDELVPELPDRFAALLSSDPGVAVDTPSAPPAPAVAEAPETASDPVAAPTVAEPAAPDAPPQAPTTDTSEPLNTAGSPPPEAPAADDGTTTVPAGQEPAAGTDVAAAPESVGGQDAAPAASGETAPADGASTETAAADSAAPVSVAPVETGTGIEGTAPADGADRLAADLPARTPAGEQPVGEPDAAEAADGAADPAAEAETAAVAGPETGATDLSSGPADPAAGTATLPGRPSASEAQASADPVGRVVIRATADSWVQVRDGAGDLVMTRVLRPGDVYEVPDAPGLTMVTGNAGGLEISVDGRTAPSLGEQGEVIRGVSLDAQALLSGTAAQ